MMGAHMWANDLHNTYHLEMYRRWRRKQSWLHTACWLMDYKTPYVLGLARGDTA